MLRMRRHDSLRFAALGVIAAITGTAAGQLVAALTNPAAAPVLAVGSTVIDLTPTPVKEWAVSHFGTHDKTILVGSVLAGTLLLAAGAGLLSRRRPRLGLLGLVLLVSLAGLAALTRPTAHWTDAIPALVTVVVGVLTLVVLRGRIEPSVQAHDTLMSRRGFLIGGATALVLAAAAGEAGRLISSARSRLSNIHLPTARKSLAALPAGLESSHPGISALRTPTADFYRVDTNLTVPVVDQTSWELRVDGSVDHPFSLSYDDLLALPLVERDITMTCVSNEVGGQYVGAARWLGVPLTTLLRRAGIRPGADQLFSTAVDGFTISTPLAAVLDGREPLVAVGMNGEVLPRAHGFPARLVTPGLYGFVGSTKWLTRLTVTTYADHRAYWTERGWATDAPIKISSRIDTPAPLSTIRPGSTAIGGVAWAQGDGIAHVEVSIDGSAWQPARLGPDIGVDYWRQWYLPWNATTGSHQLAVRAVGRDGTVQTPVRTTPFPDGSSGIQQIVVTVS